MFCPNCGKEIIGDMRFCGVCGTKLQTSDKSYSKENKLFRKGKSKWIYYVLSAGIILSGAYFISRNNNNKDTVLEEPISVNNLTSEFANDSKSSNNTDDSPLFKDDTYWIYNAGTNSNSTYYLHLLKDGSYEGINGNSMTISGTYEYNDGILCLNASYPASSVRYFQRVNTGVSYAKNGIDQFKLLGVDFYINDELWINLQSEDDILFVSCEDCEIPPFYETGGFYPTLHSASKDEFAEMWSIPLM